MGRDAQRPTDGARFLLERTTERDGGASADYTAAVLTPDATFEYDARLGSDGALLTARAEPAPPDLEAALAMFAKLTARAAPPWPARVLRWRARKP